MTSQAPVLTTVEVATLCQVHVNTVARWVREGNLPAVVLPGGRLRFRREDVEALLTPSRGAA